ncbi:MAG TPA: hypothetical protein VJZ71_08450 [Phycisphaerae bacterium]|nr:hypothetical protein [Phycisphaerae bacterium]
MSTLEEQICSLDLPCVGSNVYAGRFRDFSIAVSQKESPPQKLDHGEVVTSPAVLTLQIKYPSCPHAAPNGNAGSWGETIDALVASRDARIVVDQRRTILFLYDADKVLGTIELRNIVERIIDRLLQLRVVPGGNRCHECLNNPVDGPTLMEDRLTQICEDCLARRMALRDEQTQLTSAGVAGLLLIALPCVVIGALIWAGIWIAWDSLLGLFVDPGKKLRVFVPHIVEIVVVALAGAAVAWPVAWLIRRIPSRGDLFAGGVGLVYCLAAILLGELAYWTWTVRREVGGVELVSIIRALPAIWWDNGIHTFIRAGVAFLAAYLTFVFSRPKVTPLVD